MTFDEHATMRAKELIAQQYRTDDRKTVIAENRFCQNVLDASLKTQRLVHAHRATDRRCGKSENQCK